MKKIISLIISIISFASASNVPAKACCLADEGRWEEYIRMPSEFEISELKSLRFGSIAVTLGWGGQDVIRLDGKAKDLSGHYNVAVEHHEQEWVFKFEGSDGSKGTLRLQLPREWAFFSVDTGNNAEQGIPILYKEVRLEGKLNGYGIFAKDITADTTFRLIFQGRGNICFKGDDFKSWILQVEGRDPYHKDIRTVYYYFYGGLR